MVMTMIERITALVSFKKCLAPPMLLSPRRAGSGHGHGLGLGLKAKAFEARS
jgi:hypothetical protein